MNVFKRAAGESRGQIMIAIGWCALSLVCQTVSNAQEKWQNLFDGKTLNGWHALPGGSWKVENGILVGKSDQKEERHGILVSNKEYKNFEVEVVFKSVNGNSGFYFRVDETGDLYGVAGFQAEIHPEEYVGGIYETGGRGWVTQPSQEDVKKYNKAGDWNTMRVRAVNGDITVTVNGTTVALLKNDPGRTQGHFGLQLHGGQEMLVMFKVVRIKEL
jgi:hypothetical protein